MRIIEEGDELRLQLVDVKKDKWLFNFTIEKDVKVLKELRNHVVEKMDEKIKEMEA